MSGPSAAQRWNANPPRQRRGFFRTIGRLWVIRTVVGLIVLAVGGIGSAAEHYGWDFWNGESGTQATGYEVQTVDQWEPRVAPYADFVAQERELEFSHPVPVEFLTEAEYVELFSAEAWTPDAATVAEYEQLSNVFDAAGLGVDTDLLAAETTVLANNTLGVYYPEIDTVFIRGTALTPAVQAVLVHELTHALQAQHFSMELGGANDLELRSIIEADALRVEYRFLDTLSPTDRNAANAGLSADPDAAPLPDVPAALMEVTAAPYVLGPLLVDLAYQRDGNNGVNELLRNPPSEEILLNPWLLGTTQESSQPFIFTPDGATIIENNRSLSLFDTLMMFDAWLPWTQARGAVDGWAGGSYVSYVGDDGVTCFSVRAALDADPTSFAQAVTDWAAAAGSAAVPVIDGSDVSFTACDRPASAGAPPPAAVSMTEAAYLENVTLLDTPPDDQSGWRCFARGMIDDDAAGPLLLEFELDVDQEAILTWVQTAQASQCGVALAE